MYLCIFLAAENCSYSVFLMTSSSLPHGVIAVFIVINIFKNINNNVHVDDEEDEVINRT